MTAIQIQIGDEDLSLLQEMASQKSLEPEKCLEMMVQESLKELRELACWKQRGQNADWAKFHALLAKVPDALPAPGDELPEGWDNNNKH